ncbi:MAG: glycosyltransferase family 2 protein, partial [Candidatus Marinimicrobia bacterium]|nr:glycosyltransferase family 2 protein [Candidatus Neomarinimicrobiota bacterium]
MENKGQINLISVVVPVYNEVDSLREMCGNIQTALKKSAYDFEIILVDDGSRDGSYPVEQELAAKNPEISLIRFNRNLGKAAALNEGFAVAKGDFVATIDADLQDDPEAIPQMADFIKGSDFDLISGWKQDRKDRFIKKHTSKIYNFFSRLMTGVKLHDMNNGLKVYKAEVVKSITVYGEMHRFIPCFAAWLGVKVTEIPVNHRPRIHGQAKYGLSRVPRVIFDLLVVRFFSDYMTRPIQFFGKIARKLSFIGLIALLFLTGLDIFTPLEISAGEM